MGGPDIDLRAHLGAVELSALVDEAAADETRAHAADCQQCRERLRSWRLVRDRIAALDDERARRVSEGRRAEVVAAVTAGAPVPGSRRRRWPFRRSSG